MRRYQSDVLVVGGGGAGLMAAHAATKHDVRVAVVNKGRIQRTGATIMAPGALAAVDDRWKTPGDSKEAHLADTIKGGGYVNDQELVALMVEHSGRCVLELEQMGALFQREDDGRRYALRIDGGHSYARSPYVEDRVGKEMMKGLNGAVLKRNVAVYEDIIVTKILTNDDAVCGALGVSADNLEVVLFECKALVLATGGMGSAYANNDNPIDTTGDGYALALQAGAQLRDMEFVQFYPIGLLFPPVLKGVLGGFCYYARLYNAQGERFMERYDPERLELSTRDKVSQAIVNEIREGRGTPRGGVFMDLSFNEPGFIKRMTPALHATYERMGLDPEKDMIEIAPTVHFFMGGADVNPCWETAVQGLFAAGEAAGGLHGANRLGQNALSDILVSGDIAGSNAAIHAQASSQAGVDLGEARALEEELGSLLARKTGTEPHELKTRLQQLMWEKVGVLRNESQLEEAYDALEEMESEELFVQDKSRVWNRAVVEAFEVRSMLLASKAIVVSALERRESREAHFRSDYPKSNNAEYLKTFLVRQCDGRLELATREVSLSRFWEVE